MQDMTISDEQVLTQLNNLDTRPTPVTAAFRSITEAEAALRRQKTERLRAARIDAGQTKQ